MAEQDRHFHFIAAGGVGMSALAKYLIERGYIVSGSDISSSKYTKMLEDMGAEINIGHRADVIKPGMTIVVSSAIHEDNPELLAAKKLNLEILHRSDMLLEISKEFSDNKNAIFFGFSGTHGKTTTSGLCSFLLKKAGHNPSYAVGGTIQNIGNNSAYGSDKIFIAELDESDGTIVKYKPDVNIINNLSFDHPDFYKNGMPDILKTFKEYIDGTDENAVVILNKDNDGCNDLENMINRKIYTFAIKNQADYTAKNITYDVFSSEFDIYKNGEKIVHLSLSIPGEHNIYNALAVFAALDVKGFNPANYTEFYKEFTGMGRRFQKKAEFNGIRVIDDYAHHPEEIKTTLNALKGYNKGQITAVFQPHRYSRLQRFWNEFLMAFDSVDKLVVTDVYNASEEPIDNINSENLVKDFKRENVEYISGDMENVAKKLYPELKSGDIVITLGAGTVTKLGDELKKISEK